MNVCINRTLLVIVVLCCCGKAFSQDATNTVSPSKQINTIKRTNNYVWAEATGESVPVAYEAANVSLIRFISEYIVSNGSLQDADMVLLRDKAAKCERIEMQRGNMYRVFVYVKKADILPANSVETISKSEWQAATLEQAKEDTAFDSSSVAIDNIVDTSHENDYLAAEEFVNLPNRATPPIVNADQKSWQTEIIEHLLTYTNVQDAALYLDKLSSTNKVRRMGTNNETYRHLSKAYIITYDVDNHIVTIYGKELHQQRFNYKSNNYSEANEYNNNKYIWFILAN